MCLFVLCVQVDKQHQSKDFVYFRDGVRRIDFVLSYIDDKDEVKKVVRPLFRCFTSALCKKNKKKGKNY